MAISFIVLRFCYCMGRYSLMYKTQGIPKKRLDYKWLRGKDTYPLHGPIESTRQPLPLLDIAIYYSHSLQRPLIKILKGKYEANPHTNTHLPAILRGEYPDSMQNYITSWGNHSFLHILFIICQASIPNPRVACSYKSCY